MTQVSGNQSYCCFWLGNAIHLHQQVQCLDRRQPKEVVLDTLHHMVSLFAGHPLVTQGTGELSTCVQRSVIQSTLNFLSRNHCSQLKLVKGLLGNITFTPVSSLKWAFTLLTVISVIQHFDVPSMTSRKRVK